MTGGAQLNPVQKSLTHRPENRSIKKQAQEFEAIFIQQMLEKMVPVDPLLKNSPGNSIYRSMWIDSISELMAKSGSFGIAKLLVKSLDGTYNEHRHDKTVNTKYRLPSGLIKTANEYRHNKTVNTKYRLPSGLIKTAVKAYSGFSRIVIAKKDAAGR